MSQSTNSPHHRSGFVIVALVATTCLCCSAGAAVFNVRDYGATGRKSDDARPAIQNAIEACARAGGGTVELPPGDYTSGTIHLRSHITLRIDGGATLYAATNDAAYDKPGLLFGEDLKNITIDGRGTVDGQAEYEWRLNDFNDAYIRDNQLLAQAAGASMMRSFPKDLHTRKVYPHLVLLLRCKDVRIAGLSFLHSPSWTINPYACERLVIDGVYIHTSQRDGVWADGIDPDGCKDVRISNSTIVTGDDAIVFYSSTGWGPALPCENITITNCRLSSSSSALKFCDGNANSVRHVTVDNCVITNSNRGIAFMVYDGGYVSDVVLSNLTIETRRFPWFWWGDGDPIFFSIRRRSEVEGKPPKPGEPAAGSIRNVIIRNVIAHGQGSCFIMGHRDSWLNHVSLENVKLFITHDPSAAYDKAVHAMQFRYARNLTLRDVEVTWEKPDYAKWQSALDFEDTQGLTLDDFTGGPARPDFPAVVLNDLDGARIFDSMAKPGTHIFLKVLGAKSRAVHLYRNELDGVKTPVKIGLGVPNDAVKATNNF
jgi:Glycosyl hydrolases family 28